MWAMEDRRRAPRAPIVLPCTLSRRSGSAINAETVDLGPGGMRVTSARPLAPMLSRLPLFQRLMHRHQHFRGQVRRLA